MEHGGSLKGVSSNMDFVPEKGIAAVVLCNLTGVPVAKVWLALMNLALGLPIEQPRVEYPAFEWPADMAERISGEYKSGEGATYQVKVEDGQLVMQTPIGTFKLYPTGPDSAIWRHKLAENEVRFRFNEQGTAWAVSGGGRMIRRNTAAAGSKPE